MASGKCQDAGEYPASLTRPPVACPFCRESLDWRGACLRCYGSATSGDRNTWTFPGDDYEVDGVHRVKVASGPRRCCTAEQSHTAGQIMRAVIDQEIDVATALGMMEEALETGEPGGAG